MVSFVEKLRRKTGEVVMSSAAFLPSGGLAQMNEPVIPEGRAGEILLSENCVSMSTKREVLTCNTDHASLHVLNKYISDIESKGDAEPPEYITVRFPLTEGRVSLQRFSVNKLKNLAAALHENNFDANYPIVISPALQSQISGVGNKGEKTGVILIGADIIQEHPVNDIVEGMKLYLEKFKKDRQAPGIAI